MNHSIFHDNFGTIYLITPIKGNKETVMVQRDPKTTATQMWSHLQQKHISVEVCNLKPFPTPISAIKSLVQLERWHPIRGRFNPPKP